MKYHSISIFFFALTLVACAPYNDNSWNEALNKLQSITDSTLANSDPNSLVQTDISDIQWSLLYNEQDNSNNSGLPPNYIPANGESENSGSNDAILALKMEITDVDTNTTTTLTYNFRKTVNIEGTSFILLASQEDLNSPSNLVNSTKILKIDTNEETVEETSSGTTHTMLGTIQRITGISGTTLLNQLRNDDTESISITSDIGQAEAFFLLRIESPSNTTPTDYTLSHKTLLVQQNLDGIFATPTEITNR